MWLTTRLLSAEVTFHKVVFGVVFQLHCTGHDVYSVPSLTLGAGTLFHPKANMGGWSRVCMKQALLGVYLESRLQTEGARHTCKAWRRQCFSWVVIPCGKNKICAGWNHVVMVVNEQKWSSPCVKLWRNAHLMYIHQRLAGTGRKTQHPLLS